MTTLCFPFVALSSWAVWILPPLMRFSLPDVQRPAAAWWQNGPSGTPAASPAAWGWGDASAWWRCPLLTAPCAGLRWLRWRSAWCPSAVSHLALEACSKARRDTGWLIHPGICAADLWPFGVVCWQTPSRACCHPGRTGVSAAWRAAVGSERGRECWSRILPSVWRSWSRLRSACCPSVVSDFSPQTPNPKPYSTMATLIFFFFSFLFSSASLNRLIDWNE